MSAPAPSVATITAMRIYGGSFAQTIARAYQLADDDNAARLVGAFPDLFARYAEIAAQAASKGGAA